MKKASLVVHQRYIDDVIKNLHESGMMEIINISKENPETLKEVYKQSKWIGASINNFLLKIPLINYIIPPLLVLISPLIIPILSIKKSIENKNLGLFFPWMLIFMTVRYFGTIEGIFRKIYLGINVR